MSPRLENFSTYLIALLVAYSCVAYELLLASYASFMMGASIFQYSLVISLMMLSMGLGALTTHRIKSRIFETFLSVEILLALLASIAIPILYFVFCQDFYAKPILLAFVLLLGLGIGMEIPLLNSINSSDFRLSRILFFDYLGGFLGGITFPIFLLPTWGFFRVGALLGVINAFVALIFYTTFSNRFKTQGKYWRYALAFLFILTLLSTVIAEHLRTWMEYKFAKIR